MIPMMSASAAGHATPTIFVASDSVTDAELVKQLLNAEFRKVFTSTNPDKAAEEFEHQRPDVLVLAFNVLEKSERHYLGLFRLSAAVHLQPHRTVILCSKDEVRRAYELCRDGIFDDYVLFWPMTQDAPRMLMAVHHAMRELSALKADGPTPADLSAKARCLAELETLRGQQAAQGDLHVEESSQAVVQAEQEIGAALNAVVERATERIRPTVLVVDDDEFLRKIVGKILETENYHLVFAGGGIEALNILRKLRPNLILMDIMMPDMDGLEVTRQLKTVPRLAAIPVIMITGNSEKDIVKESMKAGAIDFVVKPFDRDTLLGKVAKVLR